MNKMSETNFYFDLSKKIKELKFRKAQLESERSLENTSQILNKVKMLSSNAKKSINKINEDCKYIADNHRSVSFDETVPSIALEEPKTFKKLFEKSLILKESCHEEERFKCNLPKVSKPYNTVLHDFQQLSASLNNMETLLRNVKRIKSEGGSEANNYKLIPEENSTSIPEETSFNTFSLGVYASTPFHTNINRK